MENFSRTTGGANAFVRGTGDGGSRGIYLGSRRGIAHPAICTEAKPRCSGFWPTVMVWPNQARTMTITLFRIGGELTPALVARLEKAIEAVPRVIAAFVDVAGGEAEVQHHGADAASIASAIEALGLVCQGADLQFAKAS